MMEQVNIKKISMVLFCLYILAVCILCFMKPDDLPQVERTFFGIPLDKVAHFLMFLPFTILSGLSFVHKGCSLPKGLAVIAILFIVGAGTAYGTEVIQAQTGYRAYEIGDYLADLTGLGTGTLLAALYLIFTTRTGNR